jgi:hypothetical protein
LIQRHDIGFAYGALSAGADILIAEALLEEGVDLYAVLPDREAAFMAVSVQPYGQEWVPRFEACLKAAKRVSIAPQLESSTGPLQIDLAAKMAMGHALMRAHQLQRNPVQLLLHNQHRTGSMTARHMSDWEGVGHSTLLVDVESESSGSHGLDPACRPRYVMRRRSGPELTRHTTLEEALLHAALKPLDTYDIHFEADTVTDVLSAMNEIFLPETILVTEDVASYASLSESMSRQFIFAGSLKRQSKNSLRCFTVSMERP